MTIPQATERFYQVVQAVNDDYDESAWEELKGMTKETPALLPVAIDLFVNIDYLRKTLKLWLESGSCFLGDGEALAADRLIVLTALLTQRNMSTSALAEEVANATTPPEPDEIDEVEIIAIAKEGLLMMETALRAQTKKGVTASLHITPPTTIISGDGRELKPTPTTLNLAVTRLGFH